MTLSLSLFLFECMTVFVLAKLAIPPEDLFRTEIDPETGACPYSAFDEEGIPTHLADGEEVPKVREREKKAVCLCFVLMFVCLYS